MVQLWAPLLSLQLNRPLSRGSRASAGQSGMQTSPGSPGAERSDYGQVVLDSGCATRLAAPAGSARRGSRRRLPQAHRPEGPELSARNRAVHRLLVDGVTVEYRTPDGAIRGAQARVLDFEHRPPTTGWRSTSSPWLRTSTAAGRTSCSSSTAYRWRSWSSRTRRTRTPPSGRPSSSSRLTRRGPVALCHERAAGHLRRCGGACRNAHRRTRVVQALAHRLGRAPGRSASTRAAGG